MGGPPHADPPAPFAAPPFLRSRGSRRAAAPPFLRSRGSRRAAAPPFLLLRSPREPPRPSPPSHSSCSVRRGSRRALRRPVAWWSEGFDWKHQHDPGESPSAYKIIQGRITAPQEPFAPQYCRREGGQKGIVDTYMKTQRKKQREECQQQEAAAKRWFLAVATIFWHHTAVTQ
ncbi:uncharacterized protein LOC125543608 isoform X3 [Triticum urartu]|uniref:uncharacterized protein LOC125543608 isoform X3 n=1 Tax=Triticum urartu TaxID=4572 RepID=UPI002042C6DD|nr:uncharacterized protein LOC125543608 isoform X3 [Triticum urartu]XP_048562964.1 uncharacterized protein LOC125543608 isoform X3 [Triticum urartu]